MCKVQPKLFVARQKGIDVLASVISWLMQDGNRARAQSVKLCIRLECLQDTGNGVTGHVQLILMGHPLAKSSQRAICFDRQRRETVLRWKLRKGRVSTSHMRSLLFSFVFPRLFSQNERERRPRLRGSLALGRNQLQGPSVRLRGFRPESRWTRRVRPVPCPVPCFRIRPKGGARASKNAQFATAIDSMQACRHQMMAGCDLLLMPSRYEPCGLPQMYSQMPDAYI